MDVSGEDECNEFGLFTFLERGMDTVGACRDNLVIFIFHN